MEWIIGGIIGFFIGGMFCWFIQEFRTRSTLDKESAKHNVEVAGLQARLEIADNAQRIIESAKTQMGETFRAAAADALSGNTAQFLSLANENFNKAMEFAKRVTHATRLAAAALARSYVACTFSHSFGDVPRT